MSAPSALSASSGSPRTTCGWPGAGVAPGSTYGLHSVVSGVVALAEEAGVRAGPAERLAPAELARQVDVVGQVGRGSPLRGTRTPSPCSAGRCRAGAGRAAAPRSRCSSAGVVAAGLVVHASGRGPPGASTSPSAAGARRPAMPGTLVAIGLNSPRTSAGASGFRSNMSCVAAPPSR